MIPHGNTLIWSFLEEKQAEAIRTLLGKKFRLTNWPAGTMPSRQEPWPSLALFSPGRLEHVLSRTGSSARRFRYIPKILLLENNYTQKDLELALDADIGEILRPPHNALRLRKKIRRILEREAAQNAFPHMLREISLEREILERKSQTLDFLVNFLTESQAAQDLTDILRQAAQSLKPVLSLRHLQVAFWNPRQNYDELRFYLSMPPGAPHFQAWITLLEETVRTVRSLPSPTLISYALDEYGAGASCADPDDGHLITMPLCRDGETCGFLLVLAENPLQLSRDEALAINAALLHLTLELHAASMEKNLFEGGRAVHGKLLATV